MMESTWLLFPGQTLENTKISERSHALHVDQKNWNKIIGHLDRKKIIQAGHDQDEAWKRYLNDGSKGMMKNWENSLENIRKKKEAERLRRIELNKDDRMQRFFELRQEQEKIRGEYIDKVNKQIFRTTGYAKEVTSAYITSEVLYEREKQKEFNKVLKKHDEEEVARFAEIVKENARKEVEEKKEKAIQKMEKEREYGVYLKSFVASNREKEERLKQKKIRKEALDNIAAMQEMECLKEAEEKEKSRIKLEMFEERQKIKKSLEHRKTQKEKEEKEMNEVIDIYQKAKHRIDCMKKTREKEIQAALVARRAAVTEMVGEKQEAKHEEENMQLRKAIAEKEAVEEARLAAKLETNIQMKEDRIRDRETFIERQDKQNKKTAELKKWEMINRYKSDEVMKKFNENMRKEHWRKILEYRKDLLEQIEENEEEAKIEKEIENYVDEKNLSTKENHRKFFEYANEVLEYAKKRGRPTYPIEKVIKEYKKVNSLPMDGDVLGLQNIKNNGKTKSDVNRANSFPRKNRPCKCTVVK